MAAAAGAVGNTSPDCVRPLFIASPCPIHSIIPPSTPAMSDFDSPWKEALDRYFPAFLQFFFPNIHADIDWSHDYEMLDKELQQVVRTAEVGRRHVDKLVKVWRRDGQETWVLIHIEVQSQADENFPQRMYVYNYRLHDRYNRTVVSLAVLADDQV